MPNHVESHPSRQAKAARLADNFKTSLKRLKGEPPTNARESAALAALRPQANEILDLLQRGWSANAIAVQIAYRDGVEPEPDERTFSVETIRQAIKRLKAEGQRFTSAPARRVKQSESDPQPSSDPITIPSANIHGFSLEDPT